MNVIHCWNEDIGLTFWVILKFESVTITYKGQRRNLIHTYLFVLNIDNLYIEKSNCCQVTFIKDTIISLHLFV